MPRRVRGWILFLAVLVTVASLGACGEERPPTDAGDQTSGQGQPDPPPDDTDTMPDGPPPPEFVDDEKVERLLRVNLKMGEREVKSVRCPERETTERGEACDCAVRLDDGGTGRFTATQINERGDVTFREDSEVTAIIDHVAMQLQAIVRRPHRMLAIRSRSTLPVVRWAL